MSRIGLLKRIKDLEKRKPPRKVFLLDVISKGEYNGRYCFASKKDVEKYISSMKRLRRIYIEKGRKIPEKDRIVLIINDIAFINKNIEED